MPILAIASFVVSFIGWASYVPVVKRPKLRRTLWPTRVLLYLSLLMAGVAFFLPVRDPYLNSIFVSASLISFAIFTLLYYLMIKLPICVGRPEVSKAMPEFEVTGEDGKPFSSDNFLGKGPLLFIFFRGFW